MNGSDGSVWYGQKPQGYWVVGLVRYGEETSICCCVTARRKVFTDALRAVSRREMGKGKGPHTCVIEARTPMRKANRSVEPWTEMTHQGHPKGF